MDKMRNNMQKGFTLFEMLVVVGIIAIILGIGTPIAMNVMNDSKTEEFVSNAKILEDSVSMYYRDNGVMPYLGQGDTKESVSELDKVSREIVMAKLVEAGVTQPESVLDKLIDDGKVIKIDYTDLKEYTKITEGDEGTNVFVVIDIVEEDELDEKYGVYENDLAGYVFSVDTRDKTTGIVYSGAHSITKEESEKLKDKIDELNEFDEAIFEKGMNPYGFKVVNLEDKRNATVDLTVSWTNRIADNTGSLETFKGFVGTDFYLECSTCDNGASKIYDINKEASGYPNTVTQKGNTFIMKIEGVPAGKILMTLKYDKIFYAGKDIQKETKLGYLNGNANGEPVDLEEIITDGDTGNNPPVCDTCGANEIIEGPKFDDKEELYKYYEEIATFSSNQVTAIEEGLKISGLEIKDIIVLKEYQKVGNVYSHDENRTRVFELTANEMLVPKNPYLQKDFQNNASSNYLYVIEAYKNKLVDNKDATGPENAVEVYYEK